MQRGRQREKMREKGRREGKGVGAYIYNIRNKIGNVPEALQT